MRLGTVKLASVARRADGAGRTAALIREPARGRRVEAIGLLALAVVLSMASGAAEPAATPSGDDDGFRVESRSLDDYRGTQDDVDSNITDDLATKLRQFDEWTLDGEDRAAEEAAQQAAALAAAGGPGGGGGGGSAPGNSGSATGEPNTGPFGRNATGDPTGATSGRSGQPGAPRQSVPPIRPDRLAKEDDVAKMIREAAEQETDPGRRRELTDQYEAYVDSL